MCSRIAEDRTHLCIMHVLSVKAVFACRSLWFEIAAGLVVARIVAQDQLVVLKRPA